MKRKLLIYLLGVAALAAVWLAWLCVRPEAKQIRETQSFFQINAPIEKVGAVLMDTQKYPDWNPYIIRVDGVLAAGATLTIEETIGGRIHRHTVKVSRYHPIDSFAWRGSLGAEFLLNWQDGFFLERSPSDPNQTVLIVSRWSQGALLPFYWKSFNTRDLDAARKMGSALKSRCEK